MRLPTRENRPSPEWVLEPIPQDRERISKNIFLSKAIFVGVSFRESLGVTTFATGG